MVFIQIDIEYSFRYIQTSPATFGVGDIVEARISFMVVPVSKLSKGQKSGRSSLHQTQDRSRNRDEHRLVIVLRSLALIDDSFSKVT